MNSIDHYLLMTGTEKTAFDQTLRNLGVDMVGYGGKALRHFDKNPMVSSAVLGAGLGGVEGAMTAPQAGESRASRGLRHALYGGVAGGATGGVLSGAARNIGRYGEDITKHVESIRGKNGLKDATSGSFGGLMRDTVFNSDSMRGGKALARKRRTHDAAEKAVAASNTAANVKKFRDAREALNKAGGGMGTRFNTIQAAGMLGAAGAAGAAGGGMAEKNSSARLSTIIDSMNKEANFSALAAKAIGGLSTGVGKAVQVGAANPTMAGAAIGAGTGALAAGEGNRLKGMLGGAALGAAGGAAAGKFAPNALNKVQQAGQNLSRAGKETSILAGAAQKGDTFKDMMSDQYKNVLNPFKAATP